MIVCGLKLSHDGAVALLDGDQLVFSVEIEKLANNPRYSAVDDLEIVSRILGDFGYKAADVDEWVIDGWDGEKAGSIRVTSHGSPIDIVVAPYRETKLVPNLLQPRSGMTVCLSEGESYPYTSYVHVAGHLASAYSTSGFAQREEPSFVLVWDGGLFPRLFWVDPACGVENGGELFPLIGHAYATAAHHFGPFRRTADSTTVDDLSVAGKLMAYIALGTPREPLLRVFREIFHEHFEAPTARVAEYRRTVGGFGSPVEPSLGYVHAFFRAVESRLSGTGATEEDVLASVHRFLEDLLVERLTARILAWKGEGPWNLCFVGGCALNIKWNSALRREPIFSEVWVPPFPNDSGSALGAAILGLIAKRGLGPISWNARMGPVLPRHVDMADGWTCEPCLPEHLGHLLHEAGEPVVVLNGRGELGPRALGGRSILAPAVISEMKERLNVMKARAWYRPVAPICLVEAAPHIFDPGTPDPYMLFDHQIRPEWADRIPAVRHLDGTARLQTVSTDDDPVLVAILRGYQELSGIPVLCNTSANWNGRGFFPDVASAMAWGRVSRIWSDGVLYRADASTRDSQPPI